jgi:hypothetical protein
MTRVRQIAGEDLTDSEIVDLANVLLAKARAIRADRYGMTADEAVDHALKTYAEELITQSRLKKRNTYLLNSAFTKALGFIQTSWADKPRDGLAALLVGSNIARRGAQRSIDADKHGLAHEWRAAMESDIERTHQRDIFKSGDIDQDAYRALGEMYKDDPNYTGIDRDARTLANIIFKYQELMRVSLNNAGAWIAKIPDYITHQSHDMFKVRTASRVMGLRRHLHDFINYDEDANFTAWRDFVLPRLDERTFDGMPLERREDWLRYVWRSIASGEHLSSGTTSTHGFSTAGSLAAKVSEQRILHFRDANARFEYDGKFGRGGSLYERVGYQLDHSAHTTAIMRRLGPNPHEVYNRLKKAARLLTEASVEARMAGQWRYDEKVLDAYFDDVMGVAYLPGTSPLATALRASRLIQTVSKLGGSMLSSFADTAVAASELRYQGFSATEAWAAQLDGLFQGYGARGMQRAGRMQLASELGVAMDVLRSATWSRFSAEDALPGWAARAQHAFFQMNGLTWWTDTLRLANAQAMSHRIAMNASRSLTELDANLQRLLKLFDISDREWDLMRSRSISVVEGKEYFTPKGAEALTDVEIARLLKDEGLSATKRRVAERRDEIQTKFRDLFSARSDYAILMPGARTRSFMTGSRMGVEGGTLASEVMRSASQFKSFPAAILEKVWGRELFGYGESGKVRDINATGMSRLAGFLVWSTLVGFISLYVKAYFNGRRLEVPKDQKEAANLFMAAFLQGGGAGLYGDFMLGQAYDRYGHSALSALAGPTAGTVEDLYSGVRGIQQVPFDWYFGQLKKGNPNYGNAFFAIKNNFPLINLFYTRMAFDYLFLYRLQESIAPGSLKRTEDNFKKNQHQVFKLPPSSHYRAEDLTTEDIGKLLSPF